PFALVRVSFPAGRILDRVALDLLPIERPCWSPDRGDRILFVGGNSELYVYDFPAPGRSRRATPERPRQVLWRTAPPPGDPVRYVDLCWPAMPQLGGRLLSALITREDISRPSGNTRLWWLTLSPDGGSIVAAEPAIAPGSYGPARDPVEERFP